MTPFRFGYCVSFMVCLMMAPACESESDIGQRVFRQQCSSCHNADNPDRKMGPALKGLFHHERLASNGRMVTETNVRAKINQGGNGMPSFKETLSDQDKEHVLAYLKTL
jgi:cytochrome c